MAQVSAIIGSDKRHVILVTEGKITKDTMPKVIELVQQAMNEWGIFRIVVDLTSTTYICSAFLRYLLESNRNAKRHRGKIVLCGA